MVYILAFKLSRHFPPLVNLFICDINNYIYRANIQNTNKKNTNYANYYQYTHV